ncbi:MAG: PEP-CTERM sorting domain-containing protein [Pseudomonadota bacterium]|nr:PEP-CTERM sorting domain-containing protein [Pseudomonadota bacterium]
MPTASFASFSPLSLIPSRALAARLSLAATMIFPLVAQADVLIDDFSAGSMGTLTGAGSFAESVNNVLGGVRELAYDFASLLPSNSLSLITAAPTGLLASGTMNVAGLDSTHKNFTLTYDGLLGADMNLHIGLTATSEIVVRAMADFWSAPAAGASVLTVSATDDRGVTRSLGLTPNSGAFLFDDVVFSLGNAAYSDLNLGHIDRISLAFTSALSADTYFDSVSIRPAVYTAAMPVPEADTYAYMLLGIGLVGMLARRRG